MPAKPSRDLSAAVAIVRDAGGKVIGRTRLQKIGFLLEATGLGAGFPFEYKHYGPYSEELATALRDAAYLDLIDEDERPASWGGFYSIYSTATTTKRVTPSARKELLDAVVDADPIELELVATAAFLRVEGIKDPWGETAKRKPEKAAKGRLKRAQALYLTLEDIPTPKRLPKIANA